MAHKLPNVRPYGFVWSITMGSTEIFRAPSGYVFDKINFSNLGSSSNIKFSLNTNREATTIPAFDDADIADGRPPMMFDLSTASIYWANAAIMEFNDIAWAQITSITAEETGGYSDYQLIIWGSLVPQPRCEM